MYVAAGRDPYELVEQSAKVVSDRLGTGRLRREKTLPDFVDQFGWCTWDAFYHAVSAAKVLEGLRSFHRGGVTPRFVILDDGWQDYRQMKTGECRLVSVRANRRRFPGGLRPVVRTAKSEFGVRQFLVWHAINGYWGGVDGSRLRGYKVRDAVRSFGRELLRNCPWANQMGWGMLVGLVPGRKAGAFFKDYHRGLAADGVDGVKVDNQAVLECLAVGEGGRVALIQAYRRALERSVVRHFHGRLINCMSCNTESFYMARESALMRTSTDFWPRLPDRHGLHVYTNALVGVWFGQFIQPDWDMFWSRHDWGEYHAAARAVSGGPVYVSDRPGHQNFSVLRKLVLSDGTVPRCTDVGRLTADCIFADVTREPVLLKVFNFNGRAAVLGVFNAQYHAKADERVTVKGAVSPSDVPGLEGERFAVYAHGARELRVLRRKEQWAVELAERGWEIFTIAPVEHGVAVVGLVDKYNSGGTVSAPLWEGVNRALVNVRDGGMLLLWSARAPQSVSVEGQRHRFVYDASAGGLRVRLARPGRQTVRFEF